MYYPVIPTDMKLTVTAAYITGKGIPVVITNMTTLPLRLIVKPCAPIKEADYKVTVSTNKPAVSLLDLFPGKLFYPVHDLSLCLFQGFPPIEYIYTHAFYQGRRRLSMIKLAISKEFKSISSQHIEAIK